MTYGFADSQFSVLGTSLVVVNTVVVVLETLSKRHLMTNQTNPLQLTRQAWIHFRRKPALPALQVHPRPFSY